MTVRTRFVLNAFISSLFFSISLFVCAGRINYVEGWIYFLTSLITTTTNVLAARNDLELINERSKPGEGTKSWDKALLGISAIVFIVTIVVAGLDSGRFRWSPEVSWTVN